MFWGLKLEAERQYSQLVDKPFHISHAAIGPSAHHKTTGAPSFPQHAVEVHAVVENTDYIICYLDPSKRIVQESLDLRISEGEEIVLYCRGLQSTAPSETVYLTGYFIEEVGYPQTLEDWTNDEYSASDFTEEGEEEEGDLSSLLFQDLSSGGTSDEEYVGKPLRALPPVIEEILEARTAEAGKASRRDRRSSGSKAGGREGKNGSRKPGGGEGSGEEGTDPEVQAGSGRKRKSEDQSGTPEGGTTEEGQRSSASKKKAKLETAEAAEGSSKKSGGVNSKKKKVKSKLVKLKSGTEYVDLVAGEGKQAKRGKKVFVRYTGRLAQNNKIFDSNTGRGQKPFMFRLGQGEVIRGWDEGVAGMRVGGKRKLTIPPKQGYGSSGSPPEIPPHSNLIFHVELVNVK